MITQSLNGTFDKAMTRSLIRLMIFVAFAVPMTADAAFPTPEEIWFRIENNQGELIGFQHEKRLPGTSNGHRFARFTHLSYRVEGHDPIEARFASTYENAFDDDSALSDAMTLTSWETQGTHKDDARNIIFLPVENDDWKERSYYRLSFRSGTLISVFRLYYDDKGNLVRAEAPFMGGAYIYRPTDIPLSGTMLDSRRSMPHEMHPAPYRMTSALLSGHLRYHFSVDFDAPFDLPQTATQKVVRNGNIWQVDICDDCGPGLSTDPQDLEGWTEPTAWLQSDDPAVARAARQVTGSGKDRMMRLARRSRARLKTIDYSDYLSAADAWRAKSGDCTEDALLLAALARASGIPARVVHGVIYSRTRYHGAANAFMPHSWVIAYVDGRWQDFDMDEPFDASRIALNISDGEPEARIEAGKIAGLLQWEKMASIEPYANE